MKHAISTDDEWSGVLARIGAADKLDASARAAGALTRRRGVRDGASLLRLGLGYGPGGMSLRKAAAWAQMQGIAEVSDVALFRCLRGAADWFGALAGQALAGRAQAGDIGSRPLRLVDGTVLAAPGSQGADWRLHMGFDPRTCRFTDFELTDGKGAERLERFPAVADEIRIADRGFGSRPDGLPVLAEGPGDYLVRVHWRGLRWLDEAGERFDSIRLV